MKTPPDLRIAGGSVIQCIYEHMYTIYVYENHFLDLRRSDIIYI